MIKSPSVRQLSKLLRFLGVGLGCLVLLFLVGGSSSQAPQDLGRLQMPTLIANGDNDIMVPTVNSLELAKRIPDAQLVIYPDAGHGSIIQHKADFLSKALAFIDD